MRKVFSTFFVMLAGIILLAHGVVPHHHCNMAVVSVIGIFDQAASEPHEHPCTNTSHHHGDSDEDEECVIHENFVISIKGERQMIYQPDAAPCKLHIDSFILPERIVATPYYKGVAKKYRPYIAKAYHSHLSRAKGLRAPPVC